MIVSNFNHNELMNTDTSFTELFSILKCYEALSNGSVTLAYDSDEFRVIHQHTDNAIITLVQGLQCLGCIAGTISQHSSVDNRDHEQIGFFISAIANLTEALNTLRSDADYVLKNRRITNF